MMLTITIKILVKNLIGLILIFLTYSESFAANKVSENLYSTSTPALFFVFSTLGALKKWQPAPSEGVITHPGGVGEQPVTNDGQSSAPPSKALETFGASYRLANPLSSVYGDSSDDDDNDDEDDGRNYYKKSLPEDKKDDTLSCCICVKPHSEMNKVYKLTCTNRNCANKYFCETCADKYKQAAQRCGCGKELKSQYVCEECTFESDNVERFGSEGEVISHILERHTDSSITSLHVQCSDACLDRHDVSGSLDVVRNSLQQLWVEIASPLYDDRPLFGLPGLQAHWADNTLNIPVICPYDVCNDPLTQEHWLTHHECTLRVFAFNDVIRYEGSMEQVINNALASAATICGLCHDDICHDDIPLENDQEILNHFQYTHFTQSCPFCNERFGMSSSATQELEDHMATHPLVVLVSQANAVPVQASVCCAEDGDNEAADNEFSQCPYCDFTSRENDTFTDHVLYTCPSCPYH